MRLTELPQPHYSAFKDQGGDGRLLEGEALSTAAATLRARVLDVLPNVVPFRSFNETIAQKNFDPKPRSGTIGDDNFNIVLGQDIVDFAIQTSDWSERLTPAISAEFFVVETGEHPGIYTQMTDNTNTPGAFDSAHRLLDKLARYRDVPANELPLDTPTRRKFAQEMRRKLIATLQTVHKESVDLSGENTKPQTIALDETTSRVIIAGKTAITVETVKSDGKKGSQTVKITLDDTGEFTFEDLVVDPQKPSYTSGKNSTRAQSFIEGKLANLVKEAVPEKSIR